MQKVLSLLVAFTLAWLPVQAAPITQASLSNSNDVRTFVDQTLRNLNSLPEGVDPVLLILHPKGKAWKRLHKELAVALARYGLSVEGAEIDFEAMRLEQLQAMMDLPLGEGFHTALTIEDRGGMWERIQSWWSGKVGMQHSSAHFQRLGQYLHERRQLRRNFGEQFTGNPEDFEKQLQEYLKTGEHYPYFRWVKNLPQGFGGGWRKQILFAAIASVNTFSFSLLNEKHRGLPEALLWGFTYFFNMGADYINYVRKAGRIPTWYTDSETGINRLTSNLQQTYSRRFFFLVTWGIVAGCNLLVVTPILFQEGLQSVGPWMYAVVSNATLGVFSFAFIDAFFARLRQRQLSLLQAAEELKKRQEGGGASLSAPELQELKAEEERLRQQAGWVGFSEISTRTGYYGGIYPFFKHDHLWGNEWKQYILVAMGSIGFVIDMLENAIRLNAFQVKPFVAVSDASTGPGPVSLPTHLACATHLIATSREKTDLFLQTLVR